MRKLIVLMHGLPGSGKTYIAKKLSGGLGLHYFSTDDLFMKNGKYVFDASRLNEYHKMTQDSVTQMVGLGEGVIVDNTNLRFWAIKPYVVLAQKHGFNLWIVSPDNDWSHDFRECHKRNQHGVPLEKMVSMDTDLHHDTEDLIAHKCMDFGITPMFIKIYIP